MAIHGLSRPPSPQLPTFTPPRSGASTPNRYGGSSPPLGAVAEKVALSYHSRKGLVGGSARTIANLFTPLRIPLESSSRTVGAGPPREIVVPVFAILHPSRALPFTRGNRPGPFLVSKRRSSQDLGSSSSPVRIVIALVGTVVGLFVLFLVALQWVLEPLVGLFKRRSMPFTEPSTLVFEPSEIERVWRWEIASGNYPSRRPVDGPLVNLRAPNADSTIAMEPIRIDNPALPKRSEEELAREREVKLEVLRRLRDQSGRNNGRMTMTQAAVLVPVGQGRDYIDVPLPGGARGRPYPPRPQVGLALDLDVVMDYCDFSTRQYVRDCLEVLRVNGGMETPLRRGNMEAWRGTFLRQVSHSTSAPGTVERAREALERHRGNMTLLLNSSASSFHSAVASRQQLTLASALAAKTPGKVEPHPSHPTADPACDPDYPHLFHIFWAGPFTDKPYSAALSFLYTQHLGLDRAMGSRPDPNVCRPQLWIWINPGPASSLPDEFAVRRMRKDLAKNPWSAPLLHRRFEEVISFKLWNTTEQLDGVSEMTGWREMALFNSGGVKYGSKVATDEKKAHEDDGILIEDREDKVAEAEKEVVETDAHAVEAEAKLAEARELEANATLTAAPSNTSAVIDPLPPKAKDELFERVGSTSQKYDRLTVVLSDMARFVLTHRFGGVYLDADTILLRDWEELFGWHGAFAYRWSRLEKYNTAVLKMQRGSALGNFLFRTAVANDLDFHPMTISRYTKDAGVEGLLLRLPDALFDPAWLNTEYYQRDRPAFPYFQRFEDFFETPAEINAAPNAAGFDAFFKGAYSYHFHNFWWIPFDQARNFPDLGSRFIEGERLARGRLLAAKLAALPASLRTPTSGKEGPSPTLPDGAEATGGGAAARPAQATPTGTVGGKRPDEYGPKWGDDERDFDELDWSQETVDEDWRDLSWSAVLKRTFEAFIRGETPNMYGEWLNWNEVEDEQEEEA